MALAKTTNKIFGAVTGAALALSAVFTPLSAAAEDVKVGGTQNTATEHVWNPEALELHKADNAATDYAEQNYGIGILIHVGANSFPNKHFATADEFGQTIVNVFKQKFGTDAQYFLSQNDAMATGITYHIDDLIHGSDNGTEVKNVQEALQAMPEVVAFLKVAKQAKVAQLSPIDAPQLENN